MSARSWALPVILAGALSAFAVPAFAETVLERIARTGVFSAGTRDHVAPFAYRDANGEFVGFAVDLIADIHAALETRLGRQITLDLNEVDAQSRIARVQERVLDITCDIASATWAREELIDFSLTTFFNGTRLLVDREAGQNGIGGLDAPRIGVVANSATIGVVRAAVPGAFIMEFPNMNQALAALEAGELEGISNISIILRELQGISVQPGRYMLLPRTGYLNSEPMACILPQDDSRWRDFVNRVIVSRLKGIEDYRGPYYEAYQKWFGPEADLHYPLNQDAINHFNQIRVWLDD